MENRLARVGRKFKAKFKLVNGAEFYGQILDIPDTSRVTNFISARRYLKVNSGCAVRPGDVAIINGKNYILGEHGDGFQQDVVIYRQFMMFEADMVVTWTPLTSTENSITGVASRTPDTVEAQTVYLSSQSKPDIQDEVHIPTKTKFAICNVEVGVDDSVGPYRVTKVDRQLGLFLLEMKKL